MARRGRRSRPQPVAPKAGLPVATTTAVPAGLRGEVASARNDITVPVFGTTLRPQDDILLSRGSGKGLKLYDEIERDPHAYAVLQKRKHAIVARDWEVRPGAPGRAGTKAAELVELALDAFNFDKACLDLASAVLKGYAVSEVMWRVHETGALLPAELRPRDPRRFVFDTDGALRLLTWDAMVDGVELPPRKFVVHQFGGGSDPYGLGLGHKLFWPCFFKRQGLSMWLICMEKFGSPTVQGLFPQGTPDDEQDKLLATLSSLSSQTAFVAPDGTKVSLLEAMRSGAGTHEQLCRYMDEQVSEAVLGETLTTNIGTVGSKAAASVHDGVRAELTDADCDLQSGTLNASLIRWIVDVNMPGAPYPTVWRPRPTQETQVQALRKSRAEATQAEIAAVQAYRAAGYEPADPNASFADQLAGEWRRAVQASPAPTPSPAFAAPGGPRDVVDDLADQLDQAAGPTMDALIDGIRALLDEVEAAGGGLDEVARRLAALHPTLPAEPLAELIAQAVMVAELTGRTEIMEGVPS